jgi:4-amino-4-deoxy-L-arabinose transferase-like glycosyltransferase
MDSDPRPAVPPPGPLVPGLFALLSVLVHVATIGRYGWFRDEFYYVACGEHLAFGYVDHPPLVALLARLSRALLGESLPALRVLPILTGAAVVFLAGWLAREFGGGRLAQAVACLGVLIAPVFLFNFHFFSMNAFEVLLWTLAAWVVVRIVKTGDPRLWLLFGVVAGIGLQNKHSMLVFGFGIFAALLLTPERRQLARPWIWAGGGLAFLIFLPNLIWQARHGWPTVEFLRNAQLYKNISLGPVKFFTEQFLNQHPLAFLVALAGLGWLLFSRQGRPFRLFGWAVLVIFAVLAVQDSKPYYLSPIFPLLLGAGGVALESGIRRIPSGRLRATAAGVLLVLLAAGGAVLAPLALPVLSEDTFVRYAAALGVQGAGTSERHEMGRLPQHFADMHGWDALVGEVARVYHSLPPEDQARARIYAQNYGEAGALSLLGRKQGLPPVLSGHNSYFLWGTGGWKGDLLIVLGGDEEDNRKVCKDLRKVGEVRCGDCMPYEDRNPVYICRGLDPPIDRLWPRLKRYI